MKRALFIDFDGVLFDTATEAYYISCLTYFQDPKKIRFGGDHYDLFKSFRYLTGPAWHFYYLMKAIDTHLKQRKNIDRAFRDLLKNSSASEYTEFEKTFFKNRLSIQQNNYSFWLKLNTPYQFIEVFKIILLQKEELPIYIISTKDERTIINLLQANGVSFPEQRVMGRDAFEKYQNKGNVIRKIMREKEIVKAMFIDDSVDHLRKCAHIRNLKLIQNSWGYIEKGQNNALNLGEILEKIENLLGGVL